MKYTELLVNSFYSSAHTGSISSADIAQKVVNKETGDVAKIYMLIDNGIIKDAKFQACGSVVLFASLSAIMDLIINKPVEDGLAINEKMVIKEIKQVNRCDYPMVSFAVRCINLTINSYIKKLARLGDNKIEKKPSRVRAYKVSNSINVFSEAVSKIDEIEEILDLKIEAEQKVETSQSQPSEVVKAKAVKPVVQKAVVVPAIVENKETEIKPVEIQTEPEVFEAVPTKIEVRILDDEQKVEIIKNKKAKVKAEEKIVEQEKDHNEDVIDEIDSITAKLTDAITKLNFKFDMDDSTEE